jgi:cell wall-associated NlpC family hydrolase
LNTLQKGVFVLYRRCSVKKLATVSTLTVVLVACSSAVSYSDNQKLTNSQSVPSSISAIDPLVTSLIKRRAEQTMLERQITMKLDSQIKKAERNRAIAITKFAIEKRMKELRKHVGKTRYIFSGSNPMGWDCSGLVKWYYEGLGIEIPHSATKQGRMKPKVKKPLPGDIVVVKYKNSKNYHHSGIYVGDNEMIHAGFKPGHRTEFISLEDPSLANLDIYFVRVIASSQ